MVASFPSTDREGYLKILSNILGNIKYKTVA